MSAVQLFCCVFVFVVFVQCGLTATPENQQQQRRRHRTDNRNILNDAGSAAIVPDWTGGATTGMDQLGYRLTRLEVKTEEKTQAIRTDIRETNRRLQNLEFQSSEAQTTLEGLRDEIHRFTQNPYSPLSPEKPAESKLEFQIQNLANGVKLVVSALRALNSEVASLKKDISLIQNKTNDLLKAHDEVVTKEFFNNGMLQSQHQMKYRDTNVCQSRDLINVSLPTSCAEVKERGEIQNGVYRIQPIITSKSFLVYCDMETLGGGWTVIQRRYQGSQDFYQRWHDYKHGFGNLGGEFWLGLDNIYELTGFELNELLIELEDFNKTKAIAQYSAFSVGPEVEGYPLKVLGGYSGDAGDSLMYHAGNRFSTKDMDMDAWPEGSCAQSHGGGWWYRNCDTVNLNGKYLSGPLPDQYIFQGMYWDQFKGPTYSLMKSRMLIRPRNPLSLPITTGESETEPPSV